MSVIPDNRPLYVPPGSHSPLRPGLAVAIVTGPPELEPPLLLSFPPRPQAPSSRSSTPLLLPIWSRTRIKTSETFKANGYFLQGDFIDDVAITTLSGPAQLPLAGHRAAHRGACGTPPCRDEPGGEGSAARQQVDWQRQTRIRRC